MIERIGIVNNNREMLRLVDAAKELHVAVTTLREWVARRKIGSCRPSPRIILIPRTEIERLLDETMVPALPVGGRRDAL